MPKSTGQQPRLSLYDEAYFERQHRFAGREKYKEEFNLLGKMMGIEPTDFVLDVGCSTGLTAAYARETWGCTVVGCDLPWAGLKRATGLPRVQADAHALPFQNASFDRAYLLHVIGHVNFPLQVLREVHRVLRPGGVVGLLTPNRWYVSALRPLNRLGIIPYKPDPTVLRYYHAASLERVALAAGFRSPRCALVGPLPRYLPFMRTPLLRERLLLIAERPREA